MTLAAKAAFEVWRITQGTTVNPADAFAAGWDARGGYAITRAQQLADAGKELAAACERITHCQCYECNAAISAALKRWENASNG